MLPLVVLEVVASGVAVPVVLESLAVVASGVAVPVVLESVLVLVLPAPVAIIDDSNDTSCDTGITTMRGWNRLDVPLLVVLPLVEPAVEPAMPMFMPSKVKMVPDSVPLLLVLPLVEPASMPIMLTAPFCTVTLGMTDESTSKVTPPELMFGPVRGVPAVEPVVLLDVVASGVVPAVEPVVPASGVAVPASVPVVDSVVASAVAPAPAVLASVGAAVAAGSAPVVPSLLVVVLSAPDGAADVPVCTELFDGTLPPHAASTTIAPIAIMVRSL